MIVEPMAADSLEQNLNPVGRVYYGASSLICVPVSLARHGPALGAPAGEGRLRQVLVEAVDLRASGVRQRRRSTSCSKRVPKAQRVRKNRESARIRAGRSAGFALPMPARTASVRAQCASAPVDPEQPQTVCIILPVISRLEMAAPKQPFTRRRRGAIGPLRALGGRRPITLHKLPSSITCRQFCDIVVADRGRASAFRGHKVRQNVRTGAAHD
jgi:hypothetical protein